MHHYNEPQISSLLAIELSYLCHNYIYNTLYALTMYVYHCTITIQPMTLTNNDSGTLCTRPRLADMV